MLCEYCACNQMRSMNARMHTRAPAKLYSCVCVFRNRESGEGSIGVWNSEVVLGRPLKGDPS